MKISDKVQKAMTKKTKTKNHEQPRCTTLVRPFVPTICNFLLIGISNKSITLLGCAYYTVGGSRAIKLTFIDICGERRIIITQVQAKF